MNIFKVLSSGDGRLKEPNLSAFLGYLLNPKADHGLNSTFLQKILKPFVELPECLNKPNPLKPLFSGVGEIDEEKYIRDLSVQSRFNVDVVFEKALKRNSEKKEIVDIVIKITEREMKGKEDISYLFQEETPVALILVENKIRKSKPGKQLLDQYKGSKDDLPNYMSSGNWNKWENRIYTILISTKGQEIKDQFNEFISHPDGNKNSIHWIWDDAESSEDNSIKKILLELLEENAKGEIVPIPTYTVDTLRALINFVENRFRSDADDQKTGGGEKIYTSKPVTEDVFIEHMNTFGSKKLYQIFKDLDKSIQNLFIKNHLNPVLKFTKPKGIPKKVYSKGEEKKSAYYIRIEIDKNNIRLLLPVPSNRLDDTFICSELESCNWQSPWSPQKTQTVYANIISSKMDQAQIQHIIDSLLNILDALYSKN